MDKCPKGVENETRVDGLDAKVDNYNSVLHHRIDDTNNRISAVENAIIDIRDRLLGRPTWVIVFLLTFLSSAVVGLVVMLFRMMKG